MLPGRAHLARRRQRQVDAAAADGLLEPALLQRLDFGAGKGRGQGLVDQSLPFRIGLGQHQRVLLDRQRRADDDVLRGVLGARAQSGQQHVVHHEGLGAARFQQQERFAVVLGVDVVIAVMALEAAHVAVAGRARAGDHGLAAQVSERADARVGADQHPHRRHIVRDAERNLLLALERVGVGGAIEVDQPVHHRRNAVLRRERHPAHLQVLQAELLARRLGRAQAQVDGIAGRLALVVGKRERQRRFAVAQHDGAGVADLVEHRALGMRRCRGQHGGGGAGSEQDCRERAEGAGKAGGQGKGRHAGEKGEKGGNQPAMRRRR
ncbi:hypothetical protein CBM2637_B90078 [Cupriavidus taiwanensis]|nr:hypothetical protein CBM2637_B90078 [Cupriavidus taiwanensis]